MGWCAVGRRLALQASAVPSRSRVDRDNHVGNAQHRTQNDWYVVLR